MGISDDIRPKKYKKISDRTAKIAVTATKKEIVEELFSKQDGDDFFADTPIEKNGKLREAKKSKKKKIPSDNLYPNQRNVHSYRWIYTLAVVLVIISLSGLVIWQNLDYIKGLFNGSYKEENDQSLNEILGSTNDSLKNYDSKEQADNQANSTKESSTAKPAVDKSTIIISVLNGSGIKLSAKTVADKLSAEGYTVNNISNARSFNYQKTFIYYKSGKEVEAELVKASLPDRETETSENNSVVGASFDIVVVVGKS